MTEGYMACRLSGMTESRMHRKGMTRNMFRNIAVKPNRLLTGLFLACLFLLFLSACSLPEEEIRAERAVRDPDTVSYSSVKAERSR